MSIPPTSPQLFSLNDIPKVIRKGWKIFSAAGFVSVSYALVLAISGFFMLATIDRANFAPMMLPLAGGFMLLGPILICGFFAVADRVEAQLPTTLSDVLDGFRHVSKELLVLATVCMLLFLIWITDAATLYGFMVGRNPAHVLGDSSPAGNVWPFLLWSSAMGSVIAFVIFAISAFAVPLLYYRRAGLVEAVIMSVKTVASNLLPSVAWALTLSAGVMTSILLLPLFLVVFPVLAFASHALYKELFPSRPV